MARTKDAKTASKVCRNTRLPGPTSAAGRTLKTWSSRSKARVALLHLTALEDAARSIIGLPQCIHAHRVWIGGTSRGSLSAVGAKGGSGRPNAVPKVTFDAGRNQPIAPRRILLI